MCVPARERGKSGRRTAPVYENRKEWQKNRPPGAPPAVCGKVDLRSKNVIKFREIGRLLVENGGYYDIR